MRVRRFNRHLTASGFEERPTDFAQEPVELFVLQGDSLVAVTGAAGGPGEYVFPDVPAGATYYLKQGTTYVVTDSRSVDLSVNLLGRPDAGTVEPEPTANLDLSGLEAWTNLPFSGPFTTVTPDSSLEFVSEQLGLAATVYPTAEHGATSLSEQEASFSTVTGPMARFEAEKGDRAWVVQLNPRTLGTLPDGGTQNYLTAVRALQLPAFSYSGGQPLLIAGTLQPVQTTQLSLDWKVSAFAAHAAEVNPAAKLRSSILSMSPTPYGPAEGWVGYSGDLLRLNRPRGESADATGTLSLGNPYPSSWGVTATAFSSFVVDFQIPNEPVFQASGSISVGDRPAALLGAPIVPRMRPPRGLTLDGTEAYSARTVTPGAHVISWQPPAEGTPNAYQVSLRWLDNSSGTPRFSVPAATFYTEASTTSVRVPEGVMVPGRYYYVLVRAIQASTYDVERKPFVLGDTITSGEAQTLSGLLTVPAQ